MIEELKLFVLVLSGLFCFNHLVRFIITLFQENPVPIKLSVVNKVLLYFSTAYIFTSIILAIAT